MNVNVIEILFEVDEEKTIELLLILPTGKQLIKQIRNFYRQSQKH